MKLKEYKMKIVQLLIAPENSAYQGVMLGLGSDGVVYYADNDNKWHKYFPNDFAYMEEPSKC